MASPSEEAGHRLRRARERAQLRYRDVKEASQRLVERYGNQEYLLNLSRLADIETKRTLPSLYRLYSLCAIYKLSFQTVLRWYGIDLSALPGDGAAASQPATVPFDIDAVPGRYLMLPSALSNDFEPQRTSYLSEQIEAWGPVPAALIGALTPAGARYALMGVEDDSMWPLIPPGSLLQIDERKNRIASGPWRQERDRPVYFVEGRDQYYCGWCSIERDLLILQAHPCSGRLPRRFTMSREKSEVNVIGQVVGLAIRFDRGPEHHTRSGVNLK